MDGWVAVAAGRFARGTWADVGGAAWAASTRSAHELAAAGCVRGTEVDAVDAAGEIGDGLIEVAIMGVEMTVAGMVGAATADIAGDSAVSWPMGGTSGHAVGGRPGHVAGAASGGEMFGLAAGATVRGWTPGHAVGADGGCTAGSGSMATVEGVGS